MLFILCFLVLIFTFNEEVTLVSEFFSCMYIFYGWELSMSKGDFWVLGMLLFCGSVSLWFCSHYFGWTQQLLYILILGFLCVMLFLVVGSDYWIGLMAWEFLGFVSFVLMLYYACYDTAFAAKVTLMSSRFGDVGFFFLCGLLFCDLIFLNKWFCIFAFLSMVFTKSAIVPFSSWLLEAMRAPTPVSCLVHSSTLVAAGVWFVSSYGLDIGSSCLSLCSMFCLFTIIVSAWSALYFSDMKKIVALSTCKKIAWCVFYFVCGFKLLCMAQLVSHGMAKCLLFMGVGDMLSGSFSSQNLKVLYGTDINSGVGWFSTISLVLIIAGVPYHGVFFTKHFLLSEIFLKVKGLFFFTTVYGVYLSYLYSTRLVCLIFFKHGTLSNWLSSIFLPVCLFFMLGSLVNYFFSFYLLEVKILSSLSSFLVFFSQLVGFLRGVLFQKYNFDLGWFSVFGGQDLVVKICFNLWKKVMKKAIPLLQARWEVNLFLSSLKKSGLFFLFGGLPVGVSVLVLIVLMVCSKVLILLASFKF